MEPTSDDICLEFGADENYAANSNSDDDDDFDESDVVVRHPRHSEYLLADGGDGAEADLLGTTPPRSRIRTKERHRKTKIGSDMFMQKGLRIKKSDNVPKVDIQPFTERLKKRASVMHRSRERDSKQDMSQTEHRAELPWPFPAAGHMPAVPTLVESCNRFMCLTSRLKARDCGEPERPAEEPEERRLASDDELPASRVNFHKTFSMLINMGNNVEKGCRRTISREEQVWQNELKDLIWLELQAKVAGRSLAQQDAYLCAARNAVPAVLQRIMTYRFVNKGRCQSRPSSEDQPSDHEGKDDDDHCDDNTESTADTEQGCLSLDCDRCTRAVGRAMRDISSLLDAYYAALELYPSSTAMTVDHPDIATPAFKNRLKAMCVWYNSALHLRLKMLSVRRMMRSLRRKGRAPHPPTRQSSLAENRQCVVRFDVSDNPTDSSNSDASASSHGDPARQHDSGEETSKSSDGDGREEPHQDLEQGKGDDEVDSGISHEEPVDRPGPPTPEIIISDSKYGTADTTTSNESGYSSGGGDCPLGADVFHVGALADITRLRLLGKCEVSPYRQYHYEMLKTQGVRRCMMFINKMRKNVLQKVLITLEKPDSSPSESFEEEEETVRVFEDPKEEEKTEPPRDEELEKTAELRRFGCWSPECIAMRLPSYRSHFLVLSCICMEAVHDYLSLRLEARPDRPSCLTVKQLIHELKEGLDISTEMRNNFIGDVGAAIQGAVITPDARRDLLLVLRTYGATVECVLQQYLSYLVLMSETEHMARAWLQAEWAFTARLARRLPSAATTAPRTFTEITCNQITRLQTEFKNKFDYLVELEKSVQHTPNRYTAYVMCRAVQEVYAQWREPLLQAAQWARALAARLARAPTPAFRPQRAAILNKLMSMREFTLRHTEIVLERTRVPDEELELTEGLVTRIRELLLQMFKLGFELHKELYKLVNPPKSEDRIQRRARPASLQPTRPQEFVVTRRRRPETMIINETVNHMIHKELNRVAKDAPGRLAGPRRSVASSPPRVARTISKFTRSDSIVEDATFDDKLFDSTDSHNVANIESLLAQDEPQKDIVQLRGGSVTEGGDGPESSWAPVGAGEEREWAGKVARAVIQFARCWMRFVVERCDRGRGLRPRWASQGLEFLMLACDPCNTKHLTEEEFEELKSLMDGCISHVVGSRPRADAALTPRPRHRLQSPSPSSPTVSQIITPSPPSSVEPEPPTFNNIDCTEAHKKRVKAAIAALEVARDEKLRSLKAVGRVVGGVASYEPRLKQLTFKWQRGLKIGAGTFGKVYTVVNTESGQLLAMKELSIGAGDRRALQRAANELRVLEGVIHPHLVRYYGCELHREEMLIFMELCVEGSLEALVATSGALAEPTVRRYAKQLLSAVAELHARNIVHRDIKSGNIFLTNEGHCLKLGDFGCAVKIRANTTAPGELQGFVGTQAYMAPEVFMKSSGHGRAADLWSLGCVVTEMASGKRPFSEYDSNYQIMFVVGMGGRPEIPDTLSDEGQEFCASCLTHDPDQRPRAAQLQTHHFLMVKNDDDCKCEPAYLLT